ncbi:MAG: CBS domain-containing protein [Actinomadura rubrobrunea]|nr:CBS domain-containing protein [Actinomadura rubrobrunea]
MNTTVRSVMATDVVAVHEQTPFKEIIVILRSNGVNAAPVLDSAGRVRGVVSTSDLLLKQADPGAAEEDGAPADPRGRRERRKAGGAVAAELMTSPAITVTPETDVQSAAREMRRHGISRLVVLDGRTRRLVGIVTRSDLLRVYDRSDRDIERDVLRGVLNRRPGVDPARITVTVDKGHVVLHGSVPRRSLIPPLLRDVRRVEGVVTSTSRLDWETDDTLAGRSRAPSDRRLAAARGSGGGQA